MKIVYTRHARSRMSWRQISRAEVEQTLLLPEMKEMIGPDRYHYLRRIGKRKIRVTLAIEQKTYVIISVVDKSD